MGEKVLLVDTGFSAQPIQQAIQKYGFEVHVVGGRPDDALAKSAEHYWCLDYSDTDKLADLICKEKYQYVVPGCTDRSYTSCSILSGQYDFPGIEPPENDVQINLKDQFRRLSSRLGIPAPRVHEQSAELSFPMIIKPVDAFSGNGITVVQNSGQLAAAIEKAKRSSPSDSFVCEDYIEGQLFSHSAFLHHGKVTTDFIVREDSTVYPFAVDLSVVENQYSDTLLQQLRTAVEIIADELSLTDGLVHTQFIQAGEQIFLIEMTRRCPGDLYSALIELQTGFAYTDNYVRPFLGLEFEPNLSEPNLPTENAVVRHTLSSECAMTFNSLSFAEKVCMKKWVPLATTGESLLPSPKGRIGIAFFQCAVEGELEHIYSALQKRTLYQLL